MRGLPAAPGPLVGCFKEFGARLGAGDGQGGGGGWPVGRVCGRAPTPLVSPQHKILTCAAAGAGAGSASCRADRAAIWASRSRASVMVLRSGLRKREKRGKSENGEPAETDYTHPAGDQTLSRRTSPAVGACTHLLFTLSCTHRTRATPHLYPSAPRIAVARMRAA